MFDIGFTELLLIGVVALIVVGPKDLPGMFRTLGRFTAKAKSMAREFTRAMEDAADETGVGDVAKDLKGLTSAKNMGLDKLKDAATSFENWDPVKSGSAAKKGAATQELSEERAESARKIHAATAKTASTRLAAEAEAASSTAKPSTNKPAKKSTPQKISAKASTTGKPTKKPAAKTRAVKRAAPKSLTKKTIKKTTGKSSE